MFGATPEDFLKRLLAGLSPEQRETLAAEARDSRRARGKSAQAYVSAFRVLGWVDKANRKGLARTGAHVWQECVPHGTALGPS